MSYGNYNYGAYGGAYGAYGPPVDPRVNTIQSYINSIRLYKNPAYIRDHTADLFRFFPGLQPTYQSVPERGNIIVLKGTIPILYQNFTYNIPIKVLLPYGYPHEPPMVQLDPTPDMFVVNNHHLVDTYGNCSIGNWTPASTLSPIIKHFCDIFSTYPPLQARGSQQQQQQQPPQQPPQPPPRSTQQPISINSNNSNQNNSQNNLSSGVNSSPPAYPGGSWNQPPPSYDSYSKSKALSNSPPSSSNVLQPPQPLSNNTNNPPPLNSPPNKPLPPQPPVSNERDELIKKCTIKLQQMLSQTYESSCAEVRDFTANNKSLEDRITKLKGDIKNVEKDIEYSEKSIQSISNESEKISNQISEYEKKDTKQVSAEVLLGPKDALTKQILRLSAEILSIEDTFQYVDKSLREDRITLDEYIKIVRTLSRDQFTAKATLRKAQEVFTDLGFQAQQAVVGGGNSGSPIMGTNGGTSMSALSPPNSSIHLHQTQLSQLY